MGKSLFFVVFFVFFLWIFLRIKGWKNLEEVDMPVMTKNESTSKRLFIHRKEKVKHLFPTRAVDNSKTRYFLRYFAIHEGGFLERKPRYFSVSKGKCGLTDLQTKDWGVGQPVAQPAWYDWLIPKHCWVLFDVQPWVCRSSGRHESRLCGLGCQR